MKQILLFIFFIAQTSFVHAQCEGWTFPDGKEDVTKSYNARYTDALNAKDYKTAQGAHHWLLQNAPKLNTSIYINGAKLYNGLIEQANDESNKDILIDSLMLIYDLRIENCGEKKEVIARKAYDAYRYMVKDKGEHKNILQFFDEAYELNKTELPNYMMMPYMDIARRNFQNESITEEEMKKRHSTIMGALDKMIAAEQDAGKVAELEEMKSNIEGMITNDDPIDCNFVKNTLEPKFRENPTDIEIAKRIFGVMLKAKCTDDPLWLETGELIAEQEPGYGIYKNLGVKAQAAKDYEKAEELYDKAMKYAENAEDKAGIYARQGSMLADKGKYSDARKMYYKALETNPGDNSPYSAIGYLYYNSFNICAGKKNIVKDRAVFFAAYDMFVKGGDSRMAGQAKAQFPSTTEIFEQNMKKGGTIKIGCWIGERSTIRSRD